MPYKFDNMLVPNVLSDQTFQATGIYIGQDSGLYYAVIDPRRHNIDVWKKRWGGPLHQLTHGGLHYQRTALQIGSHYFTNGPQMTPKLSVGMPLLIQHLLQFLTILVPIPWNPYNLVISGGGIIHRGAGLNKSFFGRNGQGSFSNYVIAPDPPGATFREAIGGLVQIVSAGSSVTDSGNGEINRLESSKGICGWGKRPISPAIATDDWESDVPYLPPEEGGEIPAEEVGVLDGVIIVAGSSSVAIAATLASQMVTVGVTEAVATDGSNSVIMGFGSTLNIPCILIKDEIQRYGFCCR
jgi:hypothetical protein